MSEDTAKIEKLSASERMDEKVNARLASAAETKKLAADDRDIPGNIAKLKQAKAMYTQALGLAKQALNIFDPIVPSTNPTMMGRTTIVHIERMINEMNEEIRDLEHG